MKAAKAACAILLAVMLAASPAFAIPPESDRVSPPDTIVAPAINSPVTQGQPAEAEQDSATSSEPNDSSIETKELAPLYNEAKSPEPAVQSENVGELEALASTQALNDKFVFKVPTASYYSSAAMHYREANTETWVTMPRTTDESGYYTFSVSAFSLDDDTEYEYVVSLLSPQRTSNIGGLYYHKVVGTFSHISDGSWVHVNNNGETGVVSQSDESGVTTVTLQRAPKYLTYRARAFSLETNVPLAHGYANVPDVLDGTVQDMPNENLKWRKTYYVPAASSDSSAAAKAALANAGYPYIGTDPTDAGANSINIMDFTISYSISVNLYEEAWGVYHPNGHLLTHKLEDTLEADPASSHSIEVLSRQTATQFYLTLSQQAPSVLISGLYEGSVIQGSTTEDEELFVVTEASAGKSVEFDVGTDEVDVHLEIVGEGLYTIPLTFAVDGTSGTITLANEDEARQFAESLSFDENNTVTVKQLPMLVPKQNGPVISARSESLFEYIQNTRSFTPGHVVKGEFRISNPRSDASFRVVDYRVSANYRPFEKLLRTDTVAVRKCFSQYYPDETYSGMAHYLYDFENLVGMSMSDALFAMYKQEYPSIESLSDLPTEVLTDEIFFDDGKWVFDPERLDLSKGPYEQQNDSYVILETDPIMQELANELLYERALLITFDDTLYPLAPYLNVKDEVQTAPSERARLLYPSYRDRTDDNKTMMDDVMTSLPVLGPSGSSSDSITFDEFGFGLNGHYISNPYVKSNYEFSFDFEVILSIVGIEGVAFMDDNRNGIRDDGEALLEDVPITLHDQGGEVGTYRTDGFGRYEIPSVPAGSGYWLSVETPDGLEITADIVSDNVDGNRFLQTGATDPFDVEADEAYRYNVGFVTPTPIEYYSLSYHPNGGEGFVVDPVGTYAAGSEAVVLPHFHAEGASTGFVHEGHEFVSWNDAADGSGVSYSPDDTIVMDGHKTLYALWEPTAQPIPNPTDPPDPLPLPTQEPDASKLVKVGDIDASVLIILAGAVAGAAAFALMKLRRAKR